MVILHGDLLFPSRDPNLVARRRHDGELTGVGGLMRARRELSNGVRHAFNGQGSGRQQQRMCLCRPLLTRTDLIQMLLHLVYSTICSRVFIRSSQYHCYGASVSAIFTRMLPTTRQPARLILNLARHRRLLQRSELPSGCSWTPTFAPAGWLVAVISGVSATPTPHAWRPVRGACGRAIAVVQQ